MSDGFSIIGRPTAMIDAARSRTQLNDEHARHIIGSLRKAGARKQIAAIAKPSEG